MKSIRLLLELHFQVEKDAPSQKQCIERCDCVTVSKFYLFLAALATIFRRNTAQNPQVEHAERVVLVLGDGGTEEDLGVSSSSWGYPNLAGYSWLGQFRENAIVRNG